MNSDIKQFIRDLPKTIFCIIVFLLAMYLLAGIMPALPSSAPEEPEEIISD